MALDAERQNLGARDGPSLLEQSLLDFSINIHRAFVRVLSQGVDGLQEGDGVSVEQHLLHVAYQHLVLVLGGWQGDLRLSEGLGLRHHQRHWLHVDRHLRGSAERVDRQRLGWLVQLWKLL